MYIDYFGNADKSVGRVNRCLCTATNCILDENIDLVDMVDSGTFNRRLI